MIPPVRTGSRTWTYMEVDDSEYKTIRQALDTWEQEGKLDAAQKQVLLQSVQLKKPAGQMAQYFFLIAISCTLLAFVAIFIDDKLLEVIRKHFALSNWLIGGITAVLAGAWFAYLRRRYDRFSVFSRELFMILGGLVALTSLVYCCKDFEHRLHYSTVLLLATILLGVLGAWFRSVSLWLGALIACTGWYSAFTAWQSTQNLFLGMNFPMRFVPLGLLLLGVSWGQGYIPHLRHYRRLTFAYGLIALFTALWGISIFGNYGSYAAWTVVRQSQVILYAALFFFASGLLLYLGVRYRDNLARDIGIISLLLNLYTRYFEYFWDNTNKGVFFLVLAVSFWLLGRWVEKKRKKV